MENKDNDFYIVIGKMIAICDAVESKIDCVIATEYTGSSDNPRYARIMEELLEANKLTFSAKIDILLAIIKRRGIVLERITKAELKNDLPRLRNDLAHCHLGYDTANSGEGLELKFKTRKEYRTLQDMQAQVEDIGNRVLMELEHKFFDELWGEVK